MDRLRWDNIARAAAVLAVVALVVAWPRIKGAPPALPPAGATPVTVEEPAPGTVPQEPPAAPPVRHRRKAHPRRRATRPRKHRVRVRVVRPRAAVRAPAPVVPRAPAPVSRSLPRPAPPPAPLRAPAPTPSDVAAGEFWAP